MSPRLLARAHALVAALPLLFGGGPTGRTAAAQETPDAALPSELAGLPGDLAGDPAGDLAGELAGELAGPEAVDPARVDSALAPTLDAASPWPRRIDDRLEDLRLELDTTAARTDAPSGSSPGSALAEALASLAEAADRRAEVGIAIHELHSGAPVFHHGADRLLNPASNHKLLTAIAAVELLGADYRFTTRVLKAGDTLYIVGEGDPNLQLADLAGLAARTASALAAAHVRRIVVDDTFFSARRRAPGYDDGGPGWSYLAPSGALSLQWNTVEIAVRPGRPGEPPLVTTSPESPHLRIDNLASTGRGGGLRVATSESDGATIVSVDGRISARARTVRIRRRVGDPGLYFGETFAERLAAYLEVPRPIVERGRAPRDADTIAEHESAPLPEVLTSALAYSNNFTIEQVLRTLGARASGTPGDWANGRAVIERFFSAIGRDPTELVFVNASGYTREGRLSAEAIVALLSLLARDGSPSAALVPILPTPGGDGTLRGRLHRARGMVRAKTGTMREASALSGIVQTDAGKSYGFSILVNGRVSTTVSRRIQDRIVTALAELG